MQHPLTRGSVLRTLDMLDGDAMLNVVRCRIGLSVELGDEVHEVVGRGTATRHYRGFSITLPTCPALTTSAHYLRDPLTTR